MTRLPRPSVAWVPRGPRELGLAAVLVIAVLALGLRAPSSVGAQESVPSPAATVHPPLPLDPSHYWIVPERGAPERGSADASGLRFGEGARLIAAGRYGEGLPLVRASTVERSPLAPYARYYTGVALLGLARYDEAAAVLSTVSGPSAAEGVLKELAALRLAEAALALDDHARAKSLLDDLSRDALGEPEAILLQLARAEEAAGHQDHLLDVYRRLYYEFPVTPQAAAAQDALSRLQATAVRAEDVSRALARAEQLFGARRWTEARAAFLALAPLARGPDRDLVALRLAQSDHHLNRHQAARDALRPLREGAHAAEARYFDLVSIRALGQHATYITEVRRLVADHPESEWAAEALNGLASHYITTGTEAQADAVFRELYRRFPAHRHAERAAWRIGWRAYKAGRVAETAALFEQAAAAFPRADHRPQWLYWSGRARDRMGDRAAANERYRLTVSDYQNLYHGRLAAQILESRQQPPVPANVGIAGAPPGAEVRTGALIRELAAVQLYEDALREVAYARRVWGDSPQLQATTAWILHQQGLGLTAGERFAALRGAITTMRRAYPQFMAAGGEVLPPDVLRIIFPLDYWPLIEKYSSAHGLDPYLMAALMAQESTFTPEIRSSANAIGLMQIIPATGQRYAARLGIRNFSTEMLTHPETNVRIGMRYFKDLIDRFGGAYLALAGYNAGEGRVARWIQERPGMAQDEFIEDIPFAETQNYVKRILGSAEDYRRLYGSGVLDPHGSVTAVASLR